MSENLKLWKAVERTDPAATKSFKGKGGFSGTAISPMYLIHRATEQWGPMGGNWGLRIVNEKVVEGAPIVNPAGELIGHESIHMVQAELYHPDGSIPCFGQTTFVGRNKYGFFTDEEAPKKSLTDALTKGLSWLGFAADVHMGRYDDVKYVNKVKGDLAAEAGNGQSEERRESILKGLTEAAEDGDAALDGAWARLSKEDRKLAQTPTIDALVAIRQMAKESVNARG